MSSKKKPTIIGALGKTRDEMSRAGPTAWMALFTGNSRNPNPNWETDKEEEWLPDPNRPLKMLIVIDRVKTWLTALDLLMLQDLMNDNVEDLKASYAIAGARDIERADLVKKLIRED